MSGKHGPWEVMTHERVASSKEKAPDRGTMQIKIDEQGLITALVSPVTYGIKLNISFHDPDLYHVNKPTPPTRMTALRLCVHRHFIDNHKEEFLQGTGQVKRRRGSNKHREMMATVAALL